jgi:ABC-type bacteriocin/lantibiotic exporter with double-glycine peptidase domain
MRPVFYLQTDTRWGRIPFTSHNDKTQTIGSSGCGVTSMAMVLSTWVDPTMKPDYVAKLAVDNGYRTFNSGTDFGFFPFIAQKYRLKLVESYKTDDAVWALQHGGLVICSMTKGYFTQCGHYILAYDVQNGNIIVNDPNSTTRTQASIDIFRQQCQKYFIFYKKEEKPMTLDEAKAKVKEKFGFDDNTIQYFLFYRYGEDVIMKLAK